eukprot:340122_1
MGAKLVNIHCFHFALIFLISVNSVVYSFTIMAVQLLLSTSLFIHITTSCSYYAERHPEPPFKEVARYPLGICTGNHYSHNKIAQESELYLCGSDNTHIIKYSYTDSSKCDGEYTASIATRNPNDFSCDGEETCPYVIVKVHNTNQKNEYRKWYSSTWVTNTCQDGEIYSCDDNTAYEYSKFATTSCNDLPQKIWRYSSNSHPEMIQGYTSDKSLSIPDADIMQPPYNDGNDLTYDIFCNEADPMTVILNYPDNTMFINTGHVAWAGDGSITEEIETAVCLHGRITGQHQEIGDDSVSYCFIGYNTENNRPIYRGNFGEIRWTETAGTLGGSFGLFLYESTDPLGDKYPVAYCFSGESKDISVCNKQWYIDHGISSRYYMDESMEMTECECTVDLDLVAEKFDFGPPSVPNKPTTTVTTTTMNNGAAMKAGTTNGKGTETSDCYYYNVRMVVFIGLITCVFMNRL